MYYADIKSYDIANGEGCRVTLFVSGCTNHCKGFFSQKPGTSIMVSHTQKILRNTF
ncbi:4Fe-4S cluster-binding domain-containing protein [Bulleidia sp. HCP3S3_F2]|uniref:4Fe-4S cluster-binding domain-containing protein n=1 Tax=unclassified Bulleidia TaxID=2704656 RepID=UPI003F8CC120